MATEADPMRERREVIAELETQIQRFDECIK
jgi:hypothetical protein